jgi:hypothetical protein
MIVGATESHCVVGIDGFIFSSPNYSSLSVTREAVLSCDNELTQFKLERVWLYDTRNHNFECPRSEVFSL